MTASFIVRGTQYRVSDRAGLPRSDESPTLQGGGSRRSVRSRLSGSLYWDLPAKSSQFSLVRPTGQGSNQSWGRPLVRPSSSESATEGPAGFGSLGHMPRPLPAASPSTAGSRDECYCLAIRPDPKGPKSTAHEYLSFPCLLCPSNEGSWFCVVWWGL